MEKRALDILGENRRALNTLARLLMERETLSREEIDEALGPVSQTGIRPAETNPIEE